MNSKRTFIRNTVTAAGAKAAHTSPGMNVRNYKSKNIQKIVEAAVCYFYTDKISEYSAKEPAVKNKAAGHKARFYWMSYHQTKYKKKFGNRKCG